MFLSSSYALLILFIFYGYNFLKLNFVVIKLLLTVFLKVPSNETPYLKKIENKRGWEEVVFLRFVFALE